MQSDENDNTNRESMLPTIKFEVSMQWANYKPNFLRKYRPSLFKNKSDLAAFLGLADKTKGEEILIVQCLDILFFFYIVFPIRLLQFGRKLSEIQTI